MDGDHLTRAEFRLRYEAMPPHVKAELIEGVVHVFPPVGYVAHGNPHAGLMGLLTQYAFDTPGVGFGDNASILLDLDNMPQPDAFLFVYPEAGGQATVDGDGYVRGAPDLIAEVSATSASYDLHEKLRAYRRNGVREYLVWRTLDGEFDYFVLRDGEYVRLAPVDGLCRSEALPGLWLDVEAVRARRWVTAAAGVRRGLASPEHAAFVAALLSRGAVPNG